MSDTKNDLDLAKQLAGAPVTKAAQPVQEAPLKKEDSYRRSLGIVGLGDGGCNIASAIVANVTGENFSMGFNLSPRNKDLFNKLNVFVSADAEDGSGKDREYAKTIASKPEVFTKIVDRIIKEGKDIIITTQTTGGGSGCGSGPKISLEIAKKLQGMDKVNIPVIVTGVYPKLEDAAAVFNTLTWQNEVTKINLPYMVFNNDRVNSNSMVTHDIVNTEIADAMRVISGASFKKSKDYSMDSRDFLNVLNRPGRINVYYSTNRPAMDADIEKYILTLIESSCQEIPNMPEAQALLLKGPMEVISKLQDELHNINAKFGQPSLKFKHIEISTDGKFELAFITSGSTIPEGAIQRLKDKHEEIKYQESLRKDKGKIDLGGISNPSSMDKIKFDKIDI